MGGGLLQLVAYGAQDVYLSGNPQITFFKVAYRRHTNFSMESIEQTFNGSADFGRRVTCQISRNGDLIHRIYLQVGLENASWLKGAYAGLSLIKSVELEIGGQRIDKQYGDWMYIWNELSLPSGKKNGFDEMVGADEHVFKVSAPNSTSATHDNASIKTAVTTAYSGLSMAEKNTVLYIPLEFWFCRNPGLALPLIALQYHEVKVNLEFESLANTGIKGPIFIVSQKDSSSTQLPDVAILATDGTDPIQPKIGTAALWVDYIFLDTDERRRFAQLSHEYLIEQLQFTGEENVKQGSSKIKLNFNHPVKELVWVMQETTAAFGCYDTAGNVGMGTTSPAILNTDAPIALTGNEMVVFGRNGSNLTVSAKLQLNGHDRFAERAGKYFSRVQPFQHHNNVPSNKGINVYSFSLKPEEHQPSGTLNFSRIDSAVLNVTASSSDVEKMRVYAVNYNVLRVMSGMGGLAYSN
jgi:hypothetical protein